MELVLGLQMHPFWDLNMGTFLMPANRGLPCSTGEPFPSIGCLLASYQGVWSYISSRVAIPRGPCAEFPFCTDIPPWRNHLFVGITPPPSVSSLSHNHPSTTPRCYLRLRVNPPSLLSVLRAPEQTLHHFLLFGILPLPPSPWMSC